MIRYRCEEWTPKFILADKNGYALAKAIEAGMQYMNARVKDALSCFTDLDAMPEWRLDEVASEASIYYDYSATLETKRELLRCGMENMRRAGTPYALEQAIRAIYPGSAVKEAAEYAGEAYHYRVCASLNATEPDADKDGQIQKAVAYFGNVRSVLDGVIYGRERSSRAAIYSGLALHTGLRQTLRSTIPGEDNTVFLTDGKGTLLCDGLGNLLID